MVRAGVIFGLVCIWSCVQAATTVEFSEKLLKSRTDRYRETLKTYFVPSRHPVTGEESWLFARTGVTESLQNSIKDISTARMVRTEFQSEVADPERPSVHVPVKGENIVATFEGKNWKTASDRIIVIGAHYDSNSNSQGLTDNGSGITALLEIAREMSDAIRRGGVLRNTVIFAAFDIQKLEHGTTAPTGATGSSYFVNDYLATILYPMSGNGTAPTFRGAIILDSIMNYSPDRATQLLPSGFDLTFPNAHQYITQNLSNTGNYLAVVSKQDPKGRYAGLGADFNKHWNLNTNPAKHPMVDLEITRNMGTQALTELLKQDHMPFWNFFHNGNPTPLPAILLTDTGIWRTTPRCQTPLCEELLTPDRLEFLDKTVVTTNNLIKDMQFDIVSTSGSSTTTHSFIAVFTLAFFLRFFSF